MNEEERQRQLDFILNQQAQFAADIQKLQESQLKMVESQAETMQIVSRLASATIEGFKQTNAKIDTLIDAQIRTEERLAKVVEAQTTLTEAQTHTEQRLDALIDAQTRTEERLTTLVEAQAHTEQRLDALIDAQTRTEETLTKLAEAQTHTERRLDALIDIVREGRNGKP